MTELFSKPSPEDVLRSIRRCFPDLGATSVSLLGEGWDSWAYDAAGCVFRIPKHDYTVRSQAKERRLMPRLAKLLPLPVPDMEFACSDGPNGHAFVGHRRISGVPLSGLPSFRSAALGPALGRFLRALHSVPVSEHEAAFGDSEHAKDYGTEPLERIGQLYERVIRMVFPLISREGREVTKESFETFLAEPSNFDYDKCIVHGDIGGGHVLVNPTSRELTGIIDFGDAWPGDPAADFVWLAGGSLGRALGEEGINSAIEAYGTEARRFEGRARFYRSLYPYHSVIGGIELRDEGILQDGLRALAEIGRRREPWR